MTLLIQKYHCIRAEAELGGETSTTGSVVYVTQENGKKTAVIANAGDSCIVVIKKDGSVVQLTTDNSMINSHDEGLDLERSYDDLITRLRRLPNADKREFIRSNNIPYNVLFNNVHSEEDIDMMGIRGVWNQRSLILRAITSKNEPPVITEYEIDEENDYMILALTDGVSDPMTQQFNRIGEIMQGSGSLRKRLRRLIREARGVRGVWAKDDDASGAAGELFKMAA